MVDTANHASTRRQAQTDGGGGEKESSVPELCSLESVCGQACVLPPYCQVCLYHHNYLSTISTAALVSSTSFLYSDCEYSHVHDCTRNNEAELPKFIQAGRSASFHRMPFIM